jgi:hypothetical protein
MNSAEMTGLDRVSEDYSNNEVGDWARLVGADLRLASGCDQLFGNKVEAGQELQKAMEGYVAVLEVSKESSTRERATFGLARTYEAMAGTRQSQGELKKAEEKYQEVVDKWGEGVYAKPAKRRLKDLARKATREFYDQFAAYDPKPAFDPGKGGVGDLPFDAGSLSPGSDVPDLSKLLDSPGLSGGDAAKDDSTKTGDQQQTAPTDSEKEKGTPAGQPAAAPAEKVPDAESGDKPKESPPAADAPAKPGTE